MRGRGWKSVEWTCEGGLKPTGSRCRRETESVINQACMTVRERVGSNTKLGGTAEVSSFCPLKRDEGFFL